VNQRKTPTKKKLKSESNADLIKAIREDLLKSITPLFEKQNKRFDGVDKRFDGIDERFDGIDERFDGIDERFDGIDERFDGVDKRFDGIDEWRAKTDARFDNLQQVIRKDMINYFAPLIEVTQEKAAKATIKVSQEVVKLGELIGGKIDKLTDSVIHIRTALSEQKHETDKLKHEIDILKRAVVLKDQ
jgi:archaellum component FlaC